MRVWTAFIFAMFWTCIASAQDSESMLDLIEEPETTVYTSASFKTTQIINSQSIENVGEGVLDFRISHRFGPLNSGVEQFFGLDAANTRLAFTYGITDRLMVGIGRGTVQKAVDGFVKYKLLRQSTGKVTMPITLSLHASMAINTLEWPDPEEYRFSSRLSYTYQLLIGRKFSTSTSAMLMPTLVHRNLVTLPSLKNNVFAMGVGFRQKLFTRLALTGEYYYVFPNQIDPIYKNSLSVGFDIETGGHVFQLHFTNSIGMNDPQFITETLDGWEDGDIRFGFNISRVFTIKDRDKERRRQPY